MIREMEIGPNHLVYLDSVEMVKRAFLYLKFGYELNYKADERSEAYKRISVRYINIFRKRITTIRDALRAKDVSSEIVYHFQDVLNACSAPRNDWVNIYDMTEFSKRYERVLDDIEAVITRYFGELDSIRKSMTADVVKTTAEMRNFLGE